MNYLSISTDVKARNGEPMTFAIDEGHVLSVTMPPDEQAAGWRRHDLIDPGKGLKAQVFGVAQSSGGEIHLVLAAGSDPAGPSQLFTASGLPNDPHDPVWPQLKDRWTPLRMDAPPTRITEVIVGAPEDAGEAPLVVIGTEKRTGRVPVYLRVASGPAGNTVVRYPNLANADALLDIKAGRPAYGRGVYALYRRGNDTVLEFDGLPDPRYNVPIGATLTTPPGAMELRPRTTARGFTDLDVVGNGTFRFGCDNQRAHAQADPIADDGMLTDLITSRSSLTEDYRARSGSADLAPYPVYRTSVSLPLRTVTVDVWASEETEVEINGARHTIDPVMPARVMAPSLRRLSVSLPARDVHCPHLLLRTNLMRPEQRHVIYPDRELHRKLVDLKDGALHEAREQLGIRPDLTKEHLDHVQQALQGMARTIQYTYNRTPHGVHHDRAVLPRNMADPHFMLDFSGGGAQYRALDKAAVVQQTAGATALHARAGQGFWDDVGGLFAEAGSVVVHTVEGIGHDVVATGEHIYRDLAQTAHQIGEDVVHGDYWHIMQDFIQGGEATTRDLFTGAANVVGNAVSGAGQLLVVTLKLAGKVVQFVVHNTGVLGQALGWVLEKIGAAAGKVVVWLLDRIGWDDVLHTHDVLKERINQGLDQLTRLLEQLKQQTDRAFAHLKDELTRSIDATLRQIGTQQLIAQPAAHPAVSGSVEKSEWLLTRFSDNTSALTVAPGTTFPIGKILPGLDRFLEVIERKFGEDGQQILAAFADARTLIDKLFQDPTPAPQVLVGIALELAKGLALIGLDAINAVVDVLIEMAEDVIEGFKTLINTPITIPFVSDLYATLTKGRPLSLLDFTALLIAIPATLLSKALGNRVPFAEHGRAIATLPEPDEDASAIRDWGYTYAAVRFIQCGLSTVADALAAWDTRGQLQALGAQGEDAPTGLLGRRSWRIQTQSNETVSIDARFYVDHGLILLTFLLDIAAQLGASPVGHGDLGKGALNIQWPRIEERDNSLAGPNYWGHVTWFYDWGAILVPNLFALGGFLLARCRITERQMGMFGDAQAVINFMSGIVTLALMSHLDVVERRRMNYLRETYFVLYDKDEEQHRKGDYKTQADKSWQTWQDWAWSEKDANGHDVYYLPKPAFTALPLKTQAEYALYLKWAEQGGLDDPLEAKVLVVQWRWQWGIQRKGFANVISAFSGIGQIGTLQDIVLATSCLSLIGTVACDWLGCLGEGITHLQRTEAHELF